MKNLAMRPFVSKSPVKWLARLAPEGLAATPPGAWDKMATAGRCVGCGLCDAVVPPDCQASLWLQGAVRQPGDARLAGEKAMSLRRHAQAIRAVCPVGVDPESVADLIDLHAESLRAPPKMLGR